MCDTGDRGSTLARSSLTLVTLRHSPHRRALAAASLLLVLAACSGAPSAEDYFGAIGEDTRSYATTVQSLREAYASDMADELSSLADRSDFTDTAAVDEYFVQAKEVAIVKTADLLANVGAELRRLLDSLEELEPPEGYVVEHQDTIASGEALAAAMPSSIEAIRNLDSIEQLQETLEGTAYSVAAQRFGLACENLEAAAVAQGIEVDLQCPSGIDRVAG